MKRFSPRSVPAIFLAGLLLGVSVTTMTSAALKGSAVFVDVPSTHFADDAIGEMVSLGIIKGFDATHFGPNEPLTRGQAAILLQRLRDSLLTSNLTPKPSSSVSSSSSSSSSVSSSVSSSSSSSVSSSAAAVCVSPTDYNPGGYVHFGAREYNVEKNDATGLVTIIIARIGGNSGAGTVDYTMNSGTAIVDKDYRPLSGTLSFSSKETSKKIQIQIINNTADIASRYVTMKLSNPTGAIKIDCPNQVNLNIKDPRDTSTPTDQSAASSSSPAAATTISLAASEYTALENGTSLTVNVVRTGVTTAVSEVNYATTNGTAQSGIHYTSTNGKLTFNPGETVKSFTIPVVDNNTIEGSRSFTVSLNTPTIGVALGQATAQTTITDNESNTFGSGSVKFSSAIYEVAKSQGKAVITVRHIAGVAAFSVNFATSNGTAVSGVDYTSTSGVLQFAQGETAKTFEVPLAKDRPLSSGLTVTLSLSGMTNGITYSDPSSATIRINN